MSSIVYTAYAETESKTCKEKGMEFSTDENDARGYELIHMISDENQTEYIKLTLCWIVDKQIQVGKLITLDAKASSERYNMSNINHTITITFPKEIINYWEDSNHTRQFNYTTSNQLILTQNNFGIFESEPINFRFTVPENISATYCEYFPNEDCFEIYNLLRPTSYYLDQEIELAKQTVKLSKETLLLTKEILDLTSIVKNLTCVIIILTIPLIIISEIGVLMRWKLNVSDKWKLNVSDKWYILFVKLCIFIVCNIPMVYFLSHDPSIIQHCLERT